MAYFVQNKPFMFCRICKIIFISLLLFSCKNKAHKRNKNSLITSDTTIINNYFLNNQTDSVLIFANASLNKLNYTINKNEFIKHSQWIINKLKPTAINWKIKQHYYKNILSYADALDLDSNSVNSITNAYYNWALLSFKNEERVDDSVIICLEHTINLNNKNNILTRAEKTYAYRILGILFNQIGDLKKSLSYYQLESNFIDTTISNWVAANVINKSIALNEVGQFDSCIRLITNTLTYPAITVLRQAELFTILSDAQIQKKIISEAKKNIEKGVSILDTITIIAKDVEEKKAQAYKQKGILERLNKEYPKSIQTQLQALVHYKATGNLNGRGIAKTYIELGKSYQANNQYDSALKYYQVALQKVIPVDSVNYFSSPLPTQLYAENTIMEALDAKANALQQKFTQTGDNKYLIAAVDCHKISFEVERKLMQNFSYDESRLLMLKESKKRSEQAISNCYTLFNTTKNNTWANEAFLFAEKSKAFVLLESVKRKVSVWLN